MNWVRVIASFFLLASACFATEAVDRGNMKAEPLAESVQLCSKELHAALMKRNGNFRYVWPQDLDKVRVDKARVPDEVLDESTQWIHTMIKGKYRPEAVREWLVPVRMPKPGIYHTEILPDGTQHTELIPEEGFDDLLIMSYSVGGNRFQIQDMEVGILVLVDVNDPSLFDRDTERFVTNVLYEFFNYPEQHRDSLVFRFKSFEYDNRTIRFGVIDCNFDLRDAGSEASRTWWNHAYVWTDGRKVHLSLAKLTGEPRSGRGSPRLTTSSRFKEN